MIRRTFNVTTTLSLLAALLLAVSIVWGKLRPGRWVWVRNHTLQYVALSPGAVYWARISTWPRGNEPGVRGGPNRMVVIAKRSAKYSRLAFGICGRYRGKAIACIAPHLTSSGQDPWNKGVPRAAPIVGYYLTTRRAFVLAIPLPMAWIAIWFWRRPKPERRGFPVDLASDKDKESFLFS